MKGGTAKQLLGLTRLCVAVSHTHHPLVHPVTGGTRRLTLPSPSQQSTGTTSSLSSFCPTRSSLSILSLSTHHERGPARGVLIDVPATFVIDSTLSRDRYGKLVESDGVVHKLVQRLLEKHAESSVCARVNAKSVIAYADT
jgi:hypothetical protein